MDVIEIDGASNNGVESVREIREEAKYLPSSGSRKIYIIDEVHMLTTAAFNALLKTLEEPPAHVIFIFATTEPHKIPATILSRCQRFDYRRVTLAQIQQRLTEVIAAEKVSAEPGALSIIGRASEGSMRDALSLLDQVIAFSGNQVSVASVREAVGLVGGQTLLGILSGIFTRKPMEALALIEQAYHQGHDLRVLTRSLIEFLHAAILAKVGATNSGSLELSSEEWSELVALSAHRKLEEIEMIFQVLHHGLESIAHSPQPKVVLDVLVVKCATAEALVFLNQSSGTPQTQSTPAASVKTSATPTSTTSTSTTSTSTTSTSTTPTPAAVRAAASVSAPAVPNYQAPAPVVASTTNAPTPATQAAPAGPVNWENFIEAVRKPRPLLASILEHGHCATLPTTASDMVLMITYQPKDGYFRDQLQSKVYHEQLLTLAKEYFGKSTRVQLEIKEAGESVADRKQRQHDENQVKTREAARSHPTILEAKALFGGELGPIEVEEDRG